MAGALLHTIAFCAPHTNRLTRHSFVAIFGIICVTTLVSNHPVGQEESAGWEESHEL